MWSNAAKPLVLRGSAKVNGYWVPFFAEFALILPRTWAP
jgi:hypothetical protein